MLKFISFRKHLKDDVFLPGMPTPKMAPMSQHGRRNSLLRDLVDPHFYCIGIRPKSVMCAIEGRMK